MIGILATMVLVFVGAITVIYFLSPEYAQKWPFDEGKTSAVNLPAGYKYIKLNDGLVGSKVEEGVRKAQGLSFDSSNITISPSDSVSGNVIRLSESLVKYLNVSTEADTLCIKLSAPEEQIRQDFKKHEYIDLLTDIQLNLLPEVQDINVGSNCLISLEGIRNDSLSITSQGKVRVINCQIKEFTPIVKGLYMELGNIENLYLDLSKCYTWEVEDDCHIYREVLSSDRHQRISLEKHCKIVEWTPKTDEAYMNIEIKKKAKIILE